MHGPSPWKSCQNHVNWQIRKQLIWTQIYTNYRTTEETIPHDLTSTTQMSRTNTHGLRRDAQPAWASNCEGLTCTKYANKINLWHAQYSIEHITAQKRFQKKVNISGTHDNQKKPTYLRVAASTIDSNPLFVTDQQFLPTNHYSERNLIN